MAEQYPTTFHTYPPLFFTLSTTVGRWAVSTTWLLEIRLL